MRIPHRTSVEHDMQLLVSPGHVGGCVRTGEGVGSRVGGRRNDRGTGRGRGLLAGAGSVRCSAEGAGRAEGRRTWERQRQARSRARRYTRKTQVHARAIAAREQQRLLEVLAAEEATRNKTPTAHYSLHSHRQAGRARLSPFAITQRQRERAVSGRPLAQGQGFPPTPPRQR